MRVHNARLTPPLVTVLPAREQLIRSMVRLVAKKGYEDTTVAEVAAVAGVSEHTFYEEFASLDECLFSAYDALIDELFDRVSTAFAQGADWSEKVRGGLHALLSELVAQPEMARLAVVDVPAMGVEGRRRYRAAVSRFVEFFRAGRDHSNHGRDLPAEIELMSVGAAEAILFEEVMSGRVADLQRMLPEILFAVLVPYLGPEAAAEEMRRAGELV